MKATLFVLFQAILPAPFSYGQFFIWEELPNMPEPVSNNAVVEGFRGDTACLFSFTGIGSGLSPADIHLNSWVYNSILGAWSVLPAVPDSQGKIAAGASYVNGVIYLMGGYAVNSNFSEVTSPKVHRFDVSAHTWLTDGLPMPVPVDDHVQVTWRDSLIICISGWSNTTNVSTVQIYNPSLNNWEEGTPVPSNNSFRAFGASGCIVGDTIYYYGGTQINFGGFAANARVRKGIISPENPSQIEWSLLTDAPFGPIYRAAATAWGDRAIWIGGSGVAYNFDGLAYSNGAGVEPLESIRSFHTTDAEWTSAAAPQAPMDLRGIAKWGSDTWAIAGGMTAGQTVSAAAYRIRIAPLSAASEDNPVFKLHQWSDRVEVGFPIARSYHANLYNLSGQALDSHEGFDALVGFSLDKHPSGIYLIHVNREGETPTRIKIAHTR